MAGQDSQIPPNSALMPVKASHTFITLYNKLDKLQTDLLEVYFSNYTCNLTTWQFVEATWRGQQELQWALRIS